MKDFSTVTSSLKWRNQIKQKQLVSQISSVLLQRQNWIQVLRKFNLSPKLTPNLFIQILRKTQNNAEISLGFFNWAKTNLGLQPDIKSHCKIIQILVESGILQPARTLFDSVIQSEPTSVVLDSMLEACKCRDSKSLVLGFVLECYSNKGLIFEGLEIFRKIRVYGYRPSIRGCNTLLDALQLADEVRLAWCFYAARLRNGILQDQFTWSLVARILCKEGKIENTVKLLNSGICNAVIYNLVIDSYCKKGNFAAAVDILNEMYNKSLKPGFSTYSSILDGACKFRDVGVIEMILRDMVGRKLLPLIPFSDYDPNIQKLCELGKTYAAKMFFERALDDKIRLQDASYGCMLRALSKEGRAKEAMRVYGMILEGDIKVNRSSYYALMNVVCKEEPSEEVNRLLKDVIGRGFTSCASDLSKFIAAQCNKGRWREAEDLLNLILEKEFLPDTFCCRLLVEHYCSDRQINSAVALHDKMEKLGVSLDVEAYNVLLDGLLAERKIEESIRVFDYMRIHDVVNSTSFSIIISMLCREKELRKAMKIHDEMLKRRLKPDEATYKRLISGFV